MGTVKAGAEGGIVGYWTVGTLIWSVEYEEVLVGARWLVV